MNTLKGCYTSQDANDNNTLKKEFLEWRPKIFNIEVY